ncbi:MAG: hypothetical protein Q9M37_01505 [Desulfonauticus sp.]|nr:hypothetical protein [Desulfonauticus sp.]
MLKIRRLNLSKIVFCLILFVGLFSACAPKQEFFSFPTKNFTLAVAPCFHPVRSWEMLAGYVKVEPLDKDTLAKLDKTLALILTQRKINFIRAAITRQCIELVAASKLSRLSIFQYWLKVGQCVPCDYLLVPYIYCYQKREGTAYGVKRPAHVMFDLFLIDVKNTKLAYRFHFDERQVSLSENLFTLNKFLARKGKWVTALELFKEGLNLGLGEMGL